MAGTLTGGRRAAKKNIKKYGKDFYARIGAKGGARRVPKGFAVMDRVKVQEAGRVGGTRSKRQKKS